MAVNSVARIPTVAVIGAGVSGLVSAKEALAHNLKPTIFEGRPRTGGIWGNDGFPWEGMRTNLSHFTCRFSDFSWKDGTDDFPTQERVYDYLNDYATHFGLTERIQFNSTVLSVSRNNNQWEVTWIREGSTTSALFDYVVVASGIFSEAHTPVVPGLDSFSGQSLHSKDFKNSASFKGRRVAVIGSSHSGVEIAALIATVAEKVVHVMRTVYHILPRYLPYKGLAHKVPLDHVFYNRASATGSAGLSKADRNRKIHDWFKQTSQQEQISPLLKVTQDLSSPPFVAISDSYLPQVRDGKIDVKIGSVESINGSTITCTDGSTEKVDAIVWNTGFQNNIYFLAKEILRDVDYKSEDPFAPLLLDRCVFPSTTPDMAFVGMYRGPYFGVIEMQARWAMGVFNGSIPAPTQEEKQLGVNQEQVIREMLPRPQFPHGNYMELMEMYGKLIGAAPNWGKLKEENPRDYDLLWNIVPLMPEQYRLEGPGSNREHALTQIHALANRLQLIGQVQVV